MTRGMLISMAVAAAAFFAVYFLTRDRFANHGLWAAFIAYVFLRGFVQQFLYKSAQKNN